MTVFCKHFVGDLGTIFRFTIKDQDDAVVDISSATLKQVKFRKSDGSTETQTASFTTDGTDGKMEVATTAADLDISGPSQAQPYLEGVSGFSGHGSEYSFRIYDPIS